MIKKGFIGFFDILGYQTINIRNEIPAVSQLISDVIVNLPTRTLDLLISLLSTDEKKARVKSLYLKIETRLISDSILVSLEMPNNADPQTVSLHSMIFLSYTSQLMRQAFDSGLPLRGAVDYGDYFFSENCFAGEPIINCYRIGNQMDVAGCVITKKCYTVVTTTDSETGRNEHIKRFYFDCLIVNKGGANELYHVLNWYLPYEKWGEKKENLRAYVIDAFHAHGKDIPPNVLSKVNNTELMLHKAHAAKS